MISKFCKKGMSDDLHKALVALSCGVLRMLKEFAGTWAGVIWLIRCLCRAAGGSGCFCEFLYLNSPDSSGKDAVMLLFLISSERCLRL